MKEKSRKEGRKEGKGWGIYGKEKKGKEGKEEGKKER